MTALRRLAAPLRLARLRLARRLGRVALVVLGIAAGTAMLASVLGGSLLARDRSLERATAEIPASDRAVRALWFGIPAQDVPRRQLDAWAEHALHRFGGVTPALVYRETSVNGHVFDLAAIVRMADEWLTLVEGVVRAPDKKLHELPVLPEWELEKVLTDWNATSRSSRAN